MPYVAPIITQTVGISDSIEVSSGAIPYNEFNQGVISEKYTVVGFSVYSDNKLQLEEPIKIEYAEANGNKQVFSQTPRLDKFQTTNILSCLKIPNIPCDGLNRFYYNVLPSTDVYIIFQLDKSRTTTQVLNSEMGDSVNDITKSIIDSVYEGIATVTDEANQLGNISLDGAKKKFSEVININVKYIDNKLPINISNIKLYKSAEGDTKVNSGLKYAAITLTLLATFLLGYSILRKK